MAERVQPFRFITDEEYECTLTEASIEKAKKELNEDPKERLNAVKQLREWVEQQPHLTFERDTVSMLSFLRTSKFSQLRARKMIEGYVAAIHNFRHWFHQIDSHDPGIQAFLSGGAIVPLPKRTKEGHHLVLYRMGKIDLKAKHYTMRDEIRASMIMGSHNSRDENTMVNGVVYIIDCTGMSLKHLTRSNNDEMRKWHKAVQNNFPGRFKAFHYYNIGALFETMMAIFGAFLPQKYKERMRVHDTAESLFKAVGMDVLPMEYLPDDYKGPCIGTCDEIVENFKNAVKQEDFRQFLIDTTTDKVHLDESKRPADIPQESFRKLNID